MSNNNLEDLVKRLETVATRLETLPQVETTKSAENMNFMCSSNNQVTIEFENLQKTEFKKFLDSSDKIGGDVKTQVQMVVNVISEEIELLKKATTSAKPSDSDLQSLMAPLSDAIKTVVDFREKNRRSNFFNHLSTVSEGIPAFGWVAVSPTPCPYIKENQDSSQFYVNRVIKDFKEKDALHVEWTKAWVALLAGVYAFVKRHFVTGLVWSGHSKATPPPMAAKPRAEGAAPPPPPPPPPAAAPSGGDDTVDRGALFSELNKGTGISSGLRKVTDDQKTHKNPGLRAGSTVAASALPSGASATKSAAGKTPVKKPPVTNLEGNKWLVEYHTGNREIVISDTSHKHTLFVHKCDNCVISVKGKINSIMMDNCKKTAIVFEGLISSLDLVNCISVQAQTLGVLPIVNIDKTDGAQIYLSADSLGAEIVSAKSSEMNVIIPQVNGDMKEMAVPEQFKTKIVNGKLVTNCTEDMG